MINSKAKLALLTALLLWASAFIGIRIGLQYYSPQGMALLRFLIASCCLALVYVNLRAKKPVMWRDKCLMMFLGGLSVFTYNLLLNFGEITVISGVASFITSQSPIIAAMLAAVILGEKLTPFRVFGFVVSVAGTALMTAGEVGGFKWTVGIGYLLFATIAGSTYSLFQKPFLARYHAIQTTSFVIWGSTIYLLVFLPYLYHDLLHASLRGTLSVIYLGVFPAAIGYLAWGYALTEISVTRAMSFLYFMPFIATFLGWLVLGEVPAMISLVGGSVAVAGVWIVSRSYRQPDGAGQSR